MNLIAPIAAGYLLLAVVTYGILIDHPEEFNNSNAGDAVRASHPHASERQIASAHRRGHQRVSFLVAGSWPLLALVLILAIPVAIYTRNRKLRQEDP